MLMHLMASPWRDTCTREPATPSRPGAGELDVVKSLELTRGKTASANKEVSHSSRSAWRTVGKHKCKLVNGKQLVNSSKSPSCLCQKFDHKHRLKISVLSEKLNH